MLLALVCLDIVLSIKEGEKDIDCLYFFIQKQFGNIIKVNNCEIIQIPSITINPSTSVEDDKSRAT